MSIEVLREEVHQLVDASDYDSLSRIKDALKKKEGQDMYDWWDDLSDEAKASLEEGIRDADEGRVITLEAFKKEHARWFPK